MDATFPGARQTPFGKTLYVTVPPAWKKLAIVEESVREAPTVIVVADRVDVIVGLAF
jgi:hypothetical protein